MSDIQNALIYTGIAIPTAIFSIRVAARAHQTSLLYDEIIAAEKIVDRVPMDIVHAASHQIEGSISDVNHSRVAIKMLGKKQTLYEKRLTKFLYMKWPSTDSHYEVRKNVSKFMCRAHAFAALGISIAILILWKDYFKSDTN